MCLWDDRFYTNSRNLFSFQIDILIIEIFPDSMFEMNLHSRIKWYYAFISYSFSSYFLNSTLVKPRTQKILFFCCISCWIRQTETIYIFDCSPCVAKQNKTWNIFFPKELSCLLLIGNTYLLATRNTVTLIQLASEVGKHLYKNAYQNLTGIIRFLQRIKITYFVITKLFQLIN